MPIPLCGLDFGTSNSTVGVYSGGQPMLVPVEDQKPTIPSAIFFDTDEGTHCFGRHAVSEYIDGAEGRLMRALKSTLGTRLMNDRTQINRKLVPFTDILGFFIAHLKHQAENTLGENINHVVLGRPVHFIDHNPDADQKAQDALEQIARDQGFQHISFQYEPVAAAMDYEQTVTHEQLALIIDIGGGTSDFSVVRVSPEGRQKADRADDVLSSTGVHIGGTDFDRLLSLQTVMPLLGYGSQMRSDMNDNILDVPPYYFHDLATWQKINFLYTRKTYNDVRDVARLALKEELIERLLHVLESRTGHHLAIEVEKVKIALTEASSTHIDLSLVEKGLSAPVTKSLLDETLAEQITLLRQAVQEALTQASVQASAIQAVFLTGGSTAIPAIRSALLDLIPNATVVDGDRFGSVGIGLTIDAHRRYG